MYEILENNGLQKGGINFDAKVRRTSTSMEDLVLAHIAGMDTYARGLKSAAKMKEEKFFDSIIQERYASYKEGIGASIVSDNENLETLTDYAMKNGEIENKSNHLEYIKSMLNDYLV